MITKDFKAIYCRACGKLIWHGVCWAGFTTKLDTKKLTILEEIICRINNLMTYELFKTSVSFEAKARFKNQIETDKPTNIKIILATHQCEKTSFFHIDPKMEPTIDEIPDYWNTRKARQEDSQGVPF
jgi:hypothetical protein